MTSFENTIVMMPMIQRMMLMKSAKLSARTTPKLTASVFQRKQEATSAPTRPISPKPAMYIRSPGWRIASAIIAAIADSTTISIGIVAAKEFTVHLPQLARPSGRACQDDRGWQSRKDRGRQSADARPEGRACQDDRGRQSRDDRGPQSADARPEGPANWSPACWWTRSAPFR